MTTNSEKIYKTLLSKETERLRGEVSSREGTNYEDLASFYLLERFYKRFKFKSKIIRICFNGLEDLDIFDDSNRIFLFQIKENWTIWDKSDHRLVEFLKRCVEREIRIRDIDNQIKLGYYFFTNKGGKLFDEWDKYKSHPRKQIDILPNIVKRLINSKFSIREQEDLIEKISFLSEENETKLNIYIDKGLLNTFKSFKNKFKPGETINFELYNEKVFYDKRLQFSRIDEPAKGHDTLISNAIELNLNSESIFYEEKRKSVTLEDIRNEMYNSRKKLCFLNKYGNLYSFQKFTSSNPLTQFIKTPIQSKEIKFQELDIRDQIYFLSDWVYNYLKFIGLRYHKLKSKRIFYFYDFDKEKTINWYDPKTNKFKKWDVVKRRGNYYSNSAAEFRVTKFDNKYLLIINPRYLFTTDGVTLLNSRDIKLKERKYRKSFMKNDFLRRWFHLFLSTVHRKSNPQKDLFSFLKPKKRSNNIFLDVKKVKINEPLSIEINFLPNNEVNGVEE